MLIPFHFLYLFLCSLEHEKNGVVPETLESQTNIKQKWLFFQIDVKYGKLNLKGSKGTA